LQSGAKRPAASLPKVVEEKAKIKTLDKPGHSSFPLYVFDASRWSKLLLNNLSYVTKVIGHLVLWTENPHKLK
jgi:hypothetical protein